MIHPTAIVDPRAEIDPSAEIGPYAVIDGPVHVGPRTRLMAHVVLLGDTHLGADNVLHPSVVLGDAPQDLAYRDAPSPVAGKGKVITCCSDRSVYDPAAGARVVSGPAPQPLATILLEHDPKADEIFAVGTIGGVMFAEFLRKYEVRLQLEQAPRALTPVERTAVVMELEHYSTQLAMC